MRTYIYIVPVVVLDSPYRFLLFPVVIRNLPLLALPLLLLQLWSYFIEFLSHCRHHKSITWPLMLNHVILFMVRILKRLLAALPAIISLLYKAHCKLWTRVPYDARSTCTISDRPKICRHSYQHPFTMPGQLIVMTDSHYYDSPSRSVLTDDFGTATRLTNLRR